MEGLYPVPKSEHGRAILSDVDREQIHERLWQRMQQEFPGITTAARTFIKQHYPEDQQEAAFDGLTVALVLLSETKATAELNELFELSTEILPAHE